MDHRSAAGRLIAAFHFLAAGAAVAFTVTAAIGPRAGAPVAGIALLCTLCLLVAASFRGGLFYGVPRYTAVLFAVVTLLLLWITSVPPYWRDELITHMALPKLALTMGKWQFLPFQPSSYSPALLLPFNMAFISAGMEDMASALSVLFILATALLVFHWAAAEAGPGAGSFAAAAVISLGVLLRLAAVSYSDPAVMFFSGAGAFHFHYWLKEPNRLDALKGGASFAAGAAVKYNAGLFMAILLTFMFLYALRTQSVRQWFTAALAAAGFTLLFCGPWWIAARTADVSLAVQSAGFGGGVGERRSLCAEAPLWGLAAPVRLFVTGEEGSRCGFDGHLNPLLLLLGGLAVWAGKKREERILFGGIVLFLISSGLLFMVVARYMLPLIPVLAVLSALYLARTLQAGRRSLAIILGALLLLWNAADTAAAARRFEGWDLLTKAEPREQFLRRTVPAYAVTQWANTNLFPVSRIYFVFTGNRVYYSNIPYTYDAYWDGSTLMDIFMRVPDAASAAAALRGLGVTHIVLMDGFMRRFAIENGRIDLYENFLRAYPPAADADGALLIALNGG